MLADIRHAVRSLFKHPIVAAAAVLSLALAIGANSAVFTLIEGIVLRPLPVPNPQRLFALTRISPSGEKSADAFSIAMFEELRRGQGVFSSQFVWLGGSMANFEVNGHLYPAALETVSGEYFETLGIHPYLGRFFTPADVALHAGRSAQVAVLSYRCWHERYQADPKILGKTLRVDGIPLTVIAVAPKGFGGIQIDAAADAIVPIGYKGLPQFREKKNAGFQIMGRLRPALTQRQAKAQIALIWPQVLRAALPDEWLGKQRADFLAGRIDLQSASTGNSWLRQRLGRPLAIMMALVGVILLIACANLGNLVLAQAAARERDSRVRLALGAKPWHLVRALFVESVLLAFLGAAAGLAISIWFSAFLIHTLWTGYVPTSVAVLPDARVLTFTGTVALLSAMLFALAPARKILQNNKGWSLQLSSRGALGGLGNAARLLLSAQTALCTLLVISAALLSATIQNLASTDRGFHSDGILILTMFPQPGRETLADRTAYYRDLAERLRGLPGVTAVSYSNMGPAMRNDFKVGVAVSGKEGQQQKAVEESVAPNVFNLLGMRVLAGRQFSWRDDSTSHPVAIISDSLAKGMFPAESPLGRKIDIGSDANQRGVEIVGIVNSASLWRLQSDRPDAVYLPLMQQPNQNEPNLEIATAGDPHVLASAARRIVEAAGHHYPLRIQTLRERSDMMLANEHVLAMVSALLATLALLMGGIGIYSLLSHSVTRRTSEIGLRIALGARPLQVTNLILAEVSRLVGLGLLVGVAVDLAISRLIEAMLFGISATNPTVVILACATLACLALVAAYSPARRAAGLDPTTALRTE